MTSGLHIHLLGEFDLTYDGVRVTAVKSPRLRTLLAYLILHRGAPQPRQHLAFLLWPDSTEEQARTNLRNLVHLLRQALPHADCCLRSEGQILVWEPHVAYTLDTAEFESAVRAGALERAVRLYRGDLLPDCYGDWVMPERERLHQLHIAALQQLLDQTEDARDYTTALGYAQQLAREDPLCEAHCRRLIHLQMLAGDRAGALRTYHACATALRRDLGVEPAPATRQLYAQVLHGCGDEPPLKPLEESLPLVGRKSEWRQLMDAWRSASNGHPQLVLLTGDVGIGKSRLAEELLGWARRQGYPAAYAACQAAEGSLPYDPIMCWLHSRPFPVLPDPWRREVARLLPEAQGRKNDSDAPWERRRLFEALARAILAWGAPTARETGRSAPAITLATEPLPILLILDDMQWCDRDTLDWLHFLLRFALHGRLLVVGAARSSDLAADQPLAPMLDSLRRHGMVTEIELAPLNGEEVLALAGQVGGRSLDPALAGPLFRGSEGNPLFVVEMVRAGMDHARPWDTRHGEAAIHAHQPLPPKIQQVLMARLAQLSPAALELAELASVIGRQCRYAVLAGAFAGDETVLVQALDELWQRRILREVGDDCYDFTHEKLREVCYEEMSAARRRLAQRRVAVTLAKGGIGGAPSTAPGRSTRPKRRRPRARSPAGRSSKCGTTARRSRWSDRRWVLPPAPAAALKKAHEAHRRSAMGFSFC